MVMKLCLENVYGGLLLDYVREERRCCGAGTAFFPCIYVNTIAAPAGDCPLWLR